MSDFIGFIEYSDGREKCVKRLKEDIADLENQTKESRKVILAEILSVYRVYYIAATNKPDAHSDAETQLEYMGRAAHRMLKSIKSINDPVSTLYDTWMHRYSEHGLLKAALENHLKAVYWTERQLEKEPKSKPQPKAQALKNLKGDLQVIFEKHNLQSETPDFDDNQGAFVLDVLEAFSL
jgi:hypothetical protein